MESDNDKKIQQQKKNVPFTTFQQKSQGTLSNERIKDLNKDLLFFFCTLSTDHVKFQREEASMVLFYKPFGKTR